VVPFFFPLTLLTEPKNKKRKQEDEEANGEDEHVEERNAIKEAEAPLKNGPAAVALTWDLEKHPNVTEVTMILSEPLQVGLLTKPAGQGKHTPIASVATEAKLLELDALPKAEKVEQQKRRRIIEKLSQALLTFAATNDLPSALKGCLSKTLWASELVAELEVADEERKNMTGPRLSDSERRLCALTNNLNGSAGVAPKETCDSVLQGEASFARGAPTDVHRDQHGHVLFLHVPVAKRVREKDDQEKVLHFCHACEKSYNHEQLCDGCNEGFRWCCAGYSREPCEDPLHPSTGAKIMLQAFCRTCLDERLLTADRVLQQEEEYLSILKVFAAPECRWRWISCLSDGWSIFSVIWTALEGLLFLLSPFYCEIGTECDDIESRSNPKFHEFVLSCANEALMIVAGESQDDMHMQAWMAVRAHPELPPNLVEADFDLTWRAVSNLLNATYAISICIWECNGQVLECAARYGRLDSEKERVIDVLKWNGGVSTHFDLLIPVEDVQSKTTPEGIDDV
jgi:hypothetical protein